MNNNNNNNNGHQRLGLVYSTMFLLLVVSFVEGYKNYTVGDSFGWFDNLEKPNVDYQKWASSKDFELGDFIIFNTNNNHSVIQTYNFTTYKLCDYEDASDNDTFQWSSANPSSTSPYPISIYAPLLKIGTTYFFSSDYDGKQCKNGQHFMINVTYGQGLPPSLRSPSNDDSLAPISPESDDNESAPNTLIPSNFDHPKDTSEDDAFEPSDSVSLFEFSKLFGVQVQLYGLFILVGFICHIC